MAAHEQADHNLVEHFILTDDYLANLRKDAVADGTKALDAFLQRSGVHIDFSGCGHTLFPLVFQL
jgi:hypothetical protein